MKLPPWIGAAHPRTLSDQDFTDAAARLGCEVATIRAVWQVEGAGRHFRADGSVERRFEPHHFPRQYWAQIGFSPAQGQAPWRASLKQSSDAMFFKAAAIDLTAACRASSWGAPQIMGFHHARLGFGSPVTMVEHMARGAAQQLGAFVQFVEGLGHDRHLRGHDWLAFARGYNGTGQPEVYAKKIEAAYRKMGGAPSPVVLRLGDRGPEVAALQRTLGVIEDGAFGPGTDAALRAFQARAGLPVDGVAGKRTWDALRDQPGVVAAPVVQPVTLDDLAGKAQTGAAAVGAVTATVAGLREVLPGDALTLVVGAVAVCGVVWFVARTLRRARGVAT